MSNGAVSRLHVIGGGLAGLAAALFAAHRGVAVTLHEAAPVFGGRCRSFDDPVLGRRLDTGSHLLLGAYGETRAYLAEAGVSAALAEHTPAAFAMADLADGRRWTVRPGDGPWWLFDRHQRPPIAPHRLIGDLWRLRRSTSTASVAACIGSASALRDLWQPLCLAVLNTAPERASARLLYAALKRTLLAGEAACRPLTAPHGLGPALIDPALERLRSHGAALHAASRITGLQTEGETVVALATRDGTRHRLGENDRVVLALDPDGAGRLLPDLPGPWSYGAIVNAHFRLEDQARLPGDAPLCGLVGATAQWLFVRGDIASVTVSDAGALAAEDPAAIARRLWADASALLERPSTPLPPWRVVKERRATIAQTPAIEAMRPGPRRGPANLWLAGDWTVPGLPATVEAAAASGRRAAALALQDWSPPPESLNIGLRVSPQR